MLNYKVDLGINHCYSPMLQLTPNLAMLPIIGRPLPMITPYAFNFCVSQ